MTDMSIPRLFSADGRASGFGSRGAKVNDNLSCVVVEVHFTL